MKKHCALLLLSILIGATAYFVACVPRPQDPSHDALLALPWQQFDQTPNSGWRTLAFTDRGGTLERRDYRAAADLIETYLRQHLELKVQQRAVSCFHVGQLRALDGHIRAGVASMKQALVPENTPDLPADWNIQVSATVAFLTGDRATLVHLKEQESNLPRSLVKWPDCPADLLRRLLDGQTYGHFK